MIGDPFHQSQRLQILNNLSPRLEAVHILVDSRHRIHFAIVGHHVDLGQFVPSSHLKVIGIMRRGNFYRTCPELAIDHRVGNDGDLAVHQWQQHFLANQVHIPLIFRIYRHGRIA